MRIQILLLATWLLMPARLAADDVLVFVAASMAEPITHVAAIFEQQNDHSIIVSAAGTSTLVRQLQADAPANVLITADRAWMEAAITGGVVKQNAVRRIASNRLSLAAPSGSASGPVALTETGLGQRLGSDMFAMADPDHVPAGRYARQALMALDLWAVVNQRQLRTDNVRSALAFIARGEVPLGIVYQTDVRADPNVKEVALLPAETHERIEYLAAVTRLDTPAAHAFVSFLGTAVAQSALAQFGFLPAQPEVAD